MGGGGKVTGSKDLSFKIKAKTIHSLVCPRTSIALDVGQ